MRRRWVGATAAGALAAFVLLSACVASARPLPVGFFGVVPQGSLGKGDFERMRGTVGTLRLPIVWAQIEPRPGEYEFGGLDQTVLAAAERGVRVLPFVYATPGWISSDPMHPPLGTAGARRAWSSFLRVLVGRYGPQGSVWRGAARREPIRSWQIWNEPNFRIFWHPHTSPVGYARLLDLSATAIREADRRARIVLAGVAPVGAGPLPWVFLRRLYRVPGARADFDAVAVHPYSATVQGTAEQVRAARQVMAAAGDARKPLLVSELGVASWGDAPSAFVKGRRGQEQFLHRAFARLVEKRREWHLAGIDWFAWQDQSAVDPKCAFCQGAGLFDLEGRPKPAWWAFRRAVDEARVR